MLVGKKQLIISALLHTDDYVRKINDLNAILICAMYSCNFTFQESLVVVSNTMIFRRLQ